MKSKRKQKRSNRIKKQKNIITIAVVLFILVAILCITYNMFFTVTTKEISYKLNGYELLNMTQEIVDGNIKLPYPAELGIEAKVGQTFSGYDTDNDGIANYQAGDLMPVSASNFSKSISVINLEDDIPFTAWLYDDKNNIAGVELKSSDYTVSNAWDYENNLKYLVIQPTFSESEGGTIEITLPVGMQWYDHDTDITTPTWSPAKEPITDVTFKTLENQLGTVYKNERTGTLTYTYNNSATQEDKIIIPVAFDKNIWDGGIGTNSQIAGEGVNVIDITMTEGSNIYKKSLSNINFQRGLPISIGTGSMNKNISQGVNHPMEYTYISNMPRYYKEIQYIFDLPTDGENYVEYIGENTVAYPGSFVDYYDFNIDQSVPGKIIYTVHDVYITSHTGITPIVFADTEKFHIGETLAMSYEFIGTTYGGTVKTSKVTIDYMKISDSVNVTSHKSNASVEYGYNDSLEVRLGGAYFRNQGALGSGNLKIEYEFDSQNPINSNQTPNILVRSISIAEKQGKQVNLNYTLIDINNNEVGSGVYTFNSANSVAGTAVTIYYLVDDYNKDNAGNQGFVPLNVDDVSIKSVNYIIDSLDAGTALYHTGASLAPYSSGNYYGKYLVDDSVISTFKLTEYDFDGGVKKETVYDNMGTYRANPTGNSLGLPKTTISQTDYRAGEEFYLKFRIYMFSYPYRTSQYSENPVIYGILPNGVEISETEIYGEFDGQTVKVNMDYWYDEEIDKNIYALSYNEGEVYLGGPTLDPETGEFIYADSSPYLYMYIPITSDPSIGYTPMNIYNTFYVGEKNGNTYQQSSYSMVEPYDFDQNGKLDKHITTYMDKDQTIAIYPNTNTFGFENEININDKEYTSDDLSYILSDDTGNIDTGVSTYRLKVQNDSDGMIAGEDFYQYIPIPKADVEYPKEMNVQNDIIDFEITSEPKILGDNGQIYDIKYTTNTELVDDDGNLILTDSDWKSKNEILNLADVTMIKITGLPKTILQSNTEDIIEVNLAYQTKSGYENSGYDSGRILSFNSYGWQKYLEGGVENTENIVSISNNVNIMIRYLTEYSENILASYVETDDNTATFEIPKYFEDKDMYVLEVKEYNVDLVSKSEIYANIDETDTNITDRNFSITAQIGAGTEYELADINSATLLGKIPANTTNNIIFEIENYNKMADASSSKYVDIILGDDEGIKYTLRLRINRNARHITEPVTAIAEGSLYKLIDTNKTNITITKQSSFTAQYDFYYTASEYENIKLEFSSNLPVDTKIRMIDSSDILINNEGNYIFSTSYYYKKIETETNHVLLTDFLNMETKEHYEKSMEPRNERVVLSFIVEFDNEYLNEGNYTISAVPVLVGGNTVESFDLGFTITGERTFEIETVGENYEIKDDILDISLNFNTNEVQGIDTKYWNEVFSLRITFDQEIPMGSFIEIKDKIFLLEESNYILNGGNYFLIPLGNIEDIENLNYTLHAPMDNYAAGSIYHELVFSEEPQGDSYARVENEFAVIDPQKPAIDLELSDGNELVTKSELSSLDLKLNYIDHDETTSFTAKIHILEKNEGAYVKQFNTIESLIIDEKIINPVQGEVNFKLDDNLQSVDLILNLNETIMDINTTYRLVVETNHLGEIKYEDITNFIVVNSD